MTGPSSPGVVRSSDRTPRTAPRAAGTLLAVVVPFLAALALWAVAAPRAELLSVGDGRGLRLADSGADGGSQLLTLIVLTGFATVSAVLVLWHRHPGLRRPGGVPALALVPGLAAATAAMAATPLAGLLAAPPEDAPYGQVVRQAPAAGELFYDRMIYGLSGPAWDWFPPGVGWLALGTMIAAFTIAALAYLDPSPDLGAD
ncbi:MULTISPECIES: hypothetical protein [Dietzia]|uniref:Uncharacterized protein n=1 Tax=Dietzia cinnamea TaxID=321318 RepID=A0A4R3ZNS5_9ACTN|nr:MULTISPECIES: hypothetical protein [Dietzia]TCW19883.1 hypothetical protein EDD19_13718 [Dietzia cinnamea]